jgi:translocation and assembly module TamB
MRWRHLLHLLWIPLALGLALAALYFLAYTPRGLAIIVHQFHGHLGPLSVEIRGASGTLARGLHIDHLVIDHRRAHIELDDVDARVSVLPLAWQTVRVPRLHAAHLLLHALPETSPRPPQAPHFLPPLMRVLANRIDVDSWQLIATNGVELDASAVTTSGVVYPDQIRIYEAALTYRAVHLRASAEVLATAPIGLGGDVHLDAEPPGQPAWTANSRFQGDLGRLEIDAHVSEPFAAVFHGEAEDLTTRWHWHGAARLQRLDLTVWQLGPALGLINGPLALDGDRDGFRARGQLTAPGLHTGALQTEFEGSFKPPVLTVSHFELRAGATGATANAAGTIAIVTGGPQLDLSGDWSRFRWPMTADTAGAQAYSDHGHYHLKGAHRFALDASAELRVGTLPTLSIASLRGELAGDGLRADAAQISNGAAHAQLSGSVHWGASHAWALQGHVDDLDIASLRPGIAGRIGFGFAARGTQLDRSSDLEASFEDLSGSVRGQRADGHGEITHHAGVWQFHDVALGLGATRIALDGRAGNPINLNFTVDADDLALIHPGARGKLQARGSLHGDMRDPTLTGNAHLQAVDWEGVHLDSLQAEVGFDPGGSGRNDARIELTGLAMAGRRVESMHLRTEGTTAHHTMAFDARGEGFRISLQGDGHYANGQWFEEIQHGEAGDGAKLDLKLHAAVPVEAQLDRLHIGELCLEDVAAKFCGTAALDPTQRRVSLQASNLPMRTLTAGLTDLTDYDGTLSVQVDAVDTAQVPWRGTINAQLVHAAIHKHFASGRTETLSLGDGLVRAELTEHELTAGLGLDAGSSGLIEGHFSAHGTDTEWRNWPLAGDLSIDTDAVGFLEAYVSQIDRASGRLKARLSLTGTSAAPELGGELDVSGGQLDAYQIALSLRDINFHASLKGDALALQGQANCGPDGLAKVDGNLHWQQGLPYGELRLKGHDLRVINIPEARVDASPDVAVRLAGQRIDVQGQVELPYARIAPAVLTNAVLPSGDEVIVNASQAAAAPRPAQIKVYSDITLQLGERVTINTSGLSGRLSGSIRVATDDTGISRGSGELKVEEGKYLAYGRNLDIQRGRLLFSNGLMGDPGLDLRAVKKFPDITAGVNVRGTLRAPRMTFFSEPEVAQSQIVSLLLAGGSLETVQNTSTTSDPTQRNSASRADLMQGGAILAQQIGGKYDFEAGVEQDLDNETSLVLGRYLSPRLYVSYGVGLAEAINTVKMRYTIGDHWTVKTEAGTQRSADLVYTIER